MGTLKPLHYTCVDMPKTVQFSDEAYATLVALKRQGESFSDVVKRLAAERKDPRRLLKLTRPDRDWNYAEVRRKMNAADKRRLRS